MTTSETERVRRRYDKDAPRYDREMGFFERLLFRDARDWVCSQAEGETLEIAIGTGLNLPHYRTGVRVTGIELSPVMLQRARSRAAELGLEADLRLGDATALEFSDGSFDTVVCTFSLCTIPDDAAAVAEAWRVLRPGGRFVLAEHVSSTRPSSESSATAWASWSASARAKPAKAGSGGADVAVGIGREGACAFG